MSSKWLPITLIISVVINLVLAGFIIGRMGHGPIVAAPDPSLAFPRFSRALPDARRDELRPIIRDYLRNMRSDRKEVFLARKAVNDAILAEPFDPKELNAALAGMHTLQTTLAKRAQKSFVHFIEGLTPAERVQFVEQNHRKMKHHPKRFRPDDRREGGRERGREEREEFSENFSKEARIDRD